MYAENRRTLDLTRFKNIIHRMVESEERIIDNFLVKSKMNKPKKDKNEKTPISSYKYMLRPVNGKDVESLEYELK